MSGAKAYFSCDGPMAAATNPGMKEGNMAFYRPCRDERLFEVAAGLAVLQSNNEALTGPATFGKLGLRPSLLFPVFSNKCAELRGRTDTVSL